MVLDDDVAPDMFTVPAMESHDDESRSCSSESLPDLHPNPFHFHHQTDAPIRESHPVAKLHCATCNTLRLSFYCFNCVNRGEFTSSRSSQVLKEKFSEKKLKLMALREEKQQSADQIGDALRPGVDMDLLRSKVNQQTLRNEQLKQSIERKKQSVEEMRGRKKDVKSFQTQARQLRELNCRKVSSAEKAIQQISDKVGNKRSLIRQGEESVRGLTWEFASQLRTHIFTLDSYDPEEASDCSSPHLSESAPLLGDSASFSRTTRSGTVRHENRFTVVEPWLPATPDCGSYSSWGTSSLKIFPKQNLNSFVSEVNVHREEIGSTASFDALEKRNDAFRISAALSYVTHMTEVLARVLDLQLPRRLSFK